MKIHAPERLRQQWQAFLKSPPGQRFIDRYHRRRQRKSTAAGRALTVVLGAVFVVAGVVMLFIPGPGIVVLMLGVALIAEQSQLMARALDWLDLKIRRAAERLKRAWQR